jgi:hypothetical protein
MLRAYYLATLSYACTCGRENHLYRYLVCKGGTLEGIDPLLYSPQGWPCSACGKTRASDVLASLRQFSKSDALLLGVFFDAIDLSSLTR